MLEHRKETLEKCVYCPKLCRAMCPVSNAEPVETLTPWGKMSTAYLMARGDVSADAEHARTAWACTGCHGCRERCDHKNEVADTLNDARAIWFERGLAPEGARRASELASAGRSAARDAAIALSSDGGGTAGLLIGCGYLRREGGVAAQAKAVTEKLLGRRVSVVQGCCGLPELLAGDRGGFLRAAEDLAAEVAKLHPIIAVDPGCARTLLVELGRAGVAAARPTLLVDLAHDRLDQFSPLGVAAPRYHDPCQLGRGLGRFDEPRRLLERVAGVAPREFERARERADCSGAGGLLPMTYPEASRRAGQQRREEHLRLGGGTIVTACAASLRRLRGAGADVDDLVTWLARGLGLA